MNMYTPLKENAVCCFLSLSHPTIVIVFCRYLLFTSAISFSSVATPLRKEEFKLKREEAFSHLSFFKKGGISLVVYHSGAFSCEMFCES